MQNAANDRMSSDLEAALLHFYSLIAKDEADRSRGAFFSPDASRHIAEARGTDLYRAMPSRGIHLARLAMVKTFTARGLECLL